MEGSTLSNPSEAIGPRDVRKAYLITYSNANTELYDREKFATIITTAFEACIRGSTVTQWACCLEQHKNGRYHFHMCVLLNKLQRWLKVKNYVKDKYGIVLHFSGHGGYQTAFSYVKKDDKEYITSNNHPVNVPSPKPKSATTKGTSRQQKKSKVKRLSNLDVSNIVLKHKLRSRIDLLAFAKCRCDAGDKRLYEFVLNRGDKKFKDLIYLVWEMETAKEKQERSKLTRLDILRQQVNIQCICNGQWLDCALDILDRNAIDRVVFADAIVTLLVLGRGKGRKVYITGPANCGDTFILDPLRVIFNTFLSPATCSYAWLGVEEKEVIFLNDVRWSPLILPWSDMLLLLEGHVVHFAAPKTSYSKDIEFSSDTPIFATAKAPISFIKGSFIDDRETEMMYVRWRFFSFKYQFQPQEQKPVPPCGHCCAKMLLQ